MQQFIFTKETAVAANHHFELEVDQFLRNWVIRHEGEILLRFDQSLEGYLANDALRDFFLNSARPLQQLLQQSRIASHLGRNVSEVYFDPTSGDPLFAITEQRIYNLAHRMDIERMHVPFRSVQPNKQTESGDTADICTYPEGSEELRYNSGNHFASRPANENVFEQHSKQAVASSGGHLQVLFKRGYLEDRLQEIKLLAAAGQTELLFFVICSRHSAKEGHFGVSLVIMDPANPDFPRRVMVCDTLLKDLPYHPRWWLCFVAEYTQVFGEAVTELLEDISHPLQKVNIKGDDPFRHDWDCPYYTAAMTYALAELVKSDPELALNGSSGDIYDGMKDRMPEYYYPDRIIKERLSIQTVNRLKRWKSGRELIREIASEISRHSSSGTN